MNINYKRLLLILSLLVVFIIPIKGLAAVTSESPINLTEIKSSNGNEATEIKIWDDCPNVFYAPVQKNFSLNQVTFKGVRLNDSVSVQVTTRESYGSSNLGKDTVTDVTYNGNNFEFTYKYNSKCLNNMPLVFVTATYNETEYNYIFAVLRNFVATTAAQKSAVFIKNVKDGIIMDNYEEDCLSASVSKLIKVNNDVDEVSFECLREFNQYTSFNSSQVKSWTQAGEIYIRYNGGPYERMAPSGDRVGENWSKDIPLTKGLNIIEISIEQLNQFGCLNKANKTYKEGLTAKGNNTINHYYTYLVYKDNDQDSSSFQKSSNTNLKYIEAVQLGASGVSMTNYGVGLDENNQYYIALPTELPEKNGEVYNHIILGAIPEDPNSSVTILDDDETNYTVCGDKVGIYQAVKYTNADDTVKNSIKVKVTAEDGSETIHTILLKQVSSDVNGSSISLNNTLLKDYTTKEEVTFSADKSLYQYVANGNVTASVVAPENASVYIDNVKATINDQGTYDIDISKPAFIIKIVAEDGITNKKYYFIKENSDGSIPLDHQSEDTKQLAKQMLTGWNGRSDEDKKNITSTYWDVFMATATNTPIDHSVAYDPANHKMTYGSDWGACILEIVMSGNNPYDYNGVDYVAGLKECKDSSGNYGPFASNTWALMALKVCGEPIEDSLLQSVKRTARSTMIGDDIRAWAIAALTGVISREDQIMLAMDMKDTIQKDGLWGNAYTNGCYFSAIGASNVNINFFDSDSSTVLSIFQEKYVTEDYKFSYAGELASYIKDAIIGLGDLINERSVYNDYALNNGRVTNLISEAEDLDLEKATDEQKTALAQAIDAAKQVKDAENGYGPAYYALYDIMGQIDDSYNLHVRLCSMAQSKQVDEVMEAIDKATKKDITMDSAADVLAAKKAYDTLAADSDKRLAGYVENVDKLEAAETELAKKIDEAITKAGESSEQGKTVSAENTKAIEAIDAVVKTLDDDMKAKVEKLSDYTTLKEAYDKAVDDLVSNLNTDIEKAVAALEGVDSKNMTDAQKEQVKELLSRLDKLNDDQKKGIKNLDKLKPYSDAVTNSTGGQDTPSTPGTPSSSGTQSGKPSAPGTSSKPAATVKTVKVGSKVISGGLIYKVTASTAKKRTVQVVGTKKKTIKTVKVPATITISSKKYKVTAIAKNAIKNRKGLKKVTIGNNVTSIGTGAFYGCKKLTTVTIGKNVKTIGSKAFYGDKKLKKITIKGTKLKKVGTRAFKGIYKKAVIKVPKKKLKAYKKLMKGKGQAATVAVR